MADYEKNVDLLAKNGSFKSINVESFKTEIKYLIPTGGSIPMSSANFFGVKRLYKRTPFIKTGQENLQKFAGIADAPVSRFLSSEYLSLLVRKKVVSDMPHGPIGGPPLSANTLTYRTGRFANSIQLQVNYRTRVLRYYYNPIYYVHEFSRRDPRVLIERNIKEVMRERFKQTFSISEMVL